MAVAGIVWWILICTCIVVLVTDKPGFIKRQDDGHVEVTEKGKQPRQQAQTGEALDADE